MATTKEEIKKKVELLSKPTWSAKDIRDYFGICLSNAYNIMSLAKELGGGVRYTDSLVSTEVVLELIQTDRNKELEVLAKALCLLP